MNAKGWSIYETYERLQLTFRTVEFLRKAICYAEEFLRLSEEIFHTSTVDAVIKVQPKDFFLEIKRNPEFSDDLDSSSESTEKKCIIKLKDIMEQEQKFAIKDVDRYQVLKENQVTFSSVNAAQSSPSPSRKNGKPVSKPSQDGHDCKKSKTCNEKWGGLGCVKIYQLATVQERKEHLKWLKLCFCCGLPFHGVPWKSGGRNTPCN